MTSSRVAVVRADFEAETHCEGVLQILDLYAQEPGISGQSLDAEVRSRLIDDLRRQPNGRYLLAILEDCVAGVAICFLGYSTFRGRPVLNLHDLAVHPELRGQGIGQALLAAVEQQARRDDCCKITLEVASDNPAAQRLYERVGFEGGDPRGGVSYFLTKPID